MAPPLEETEENMVKLRNLDEASIAVRGRAAQWGRAWAQQAP